MRVFGLLSTMFCACLISFITVPLLSSKISKFWLYIINTMLGAAMAVMIVSSNHISEEQAVKMIPLLVVVLAVAAQIIKQIPNGEEFLKTWYEADEDEDDREYFSKRDMRGKPWWKFIFIPGWITIIISGLWIVGSLLFWLITGDYQYMIAGFIMMIVIAVIIRKAKKRKRDYDNGYK